MHFDKTQFWLEFMFVSLFTAPLLSCSKHNSSLPSLHPATPPTFLTWPMLDIIGVMAVFSVGRLPLLNIPKTSLYLGISFSE
jgi:hypothetical protein